MGTQSAHYEPFVWWLARERIGTDLRKYYAPPQELPSQIVVLIERLGAVVEYDHFREQSTPGAPSLLSKLDAIEGNQLLRACRTRLRDLCCLERSGSST
jgi:hypothetical protein